MLKLKLIKNKNDYIISFLFFSFSLVFVFIFSFSFFFIICYYLVLVLVFINDTFIISLLHFLVTVFVNGENTGLDNIEIQRLLIHYLYRWRGSDSE